MKKKTIYIIVAVLILLIGGGLTYYFVAKGKGKDNIQFRTQPLTKGSIRLVVTATGTLNADTTVLVGTQVSGTIAKNYVDFNSKVKKGQVLCELDPAPFKATLDNAKATTQQKEAQLNEARREFVRNKMLLDQKVLSQADFDLSLSNYEADSAALLLARADQQKAQINIDYATIKAPISGIVVSRNVDVGQTVAASFNTPTLFSIANDLTKMQVWANVDESDIGQIELGQVVKFTVEAYRDQVFTGKVFQIRLQPTTIQNVVNYTVIIDVPNPDMKLMPGMTANITVTVKEHRDVFQVPVAALKFKPPAEYFAKTNPNGAQQQDTATAKNKGGRTIVGKFGTVELDEQGNMKVAKDTTGAVWIKRPDNTIEQRKVILGITDGTMMEVKGDLKEGDEVIIGTIKAAEAAVKSPFTPQMPSTPKRTQ